MLRRPEVVDAVLHGVGADHIAVSPRLPRDHEVVDSTQAWFWTSTWQAGEREADTDRVAGRVEEFDSAESFIDALRFIAQRNERRRPR